MIDKETIADIDRFAAEQNKQEAADMLVKSAADFVAATQDSPHSQRVYKLKSGELLPIRPVPSMIIKQLSDDQNGKPQVPIVESKLGNGKTMKEPNPNDPEYKAALQAWTVDLNQRVMAYVLTRGVCAEPDKADFDRLREFAPGLSPARLKYAWILEKLENDEEVTELMMAIVGQTRPTEKGIRDAEATFPGDDQQ